MNIIAPYVNYELDEANVYESIDKVEREGYIPNDKKIDSFVERGLVLTEMRDGVGEYELPSSESEFDEDSDEYLAELTKDAENYEEKPLLQHIDKLTAEEVLADAEKELSARKSRKKKTNDETSERKAFLSDLKTSVEQGLKEGLKQSQQ